MLATELVQIFLEVVIAPDAEDDALRILSAKPNVRVLLTGAMPDLPAASAQAGPAQKRITVRSIAGGVLVQSADSTVFNGEVKTVTKRAPTEKELADMLFAFTVCKHVKSNAILYAKTVPLSASGRGR